MQFATVDLEADITQSGAAVIACAQGHFRTVDPWAPACDLHVVYACLVQLSLFLSCIQEIRIMALS